jgi:hypothetical protein
LHFPQHDPTQNPLSQIEYSPRSVETFRQNPLRAGTPHQQHELHPDPQRVQVANEENYYWVKECWQML